jgi:hypothetical protein
VYSTATSTTPAVAACPSGYVATGGGGIPGAAGGAVYSAPYYSSTYIGNPIHGNTGTTGQTNAPTAWIAFGNGTTTGTTAYAVCSK